MKTLHLLLLLSISHAGSLIDPFVLVAGPNLFFSKDSTKKDLWIPHYGLESSIWYGDGLGEDFKGRLYGVDLGYEWSQNSQSIYFQFQSYLHNPFAEDPQNFPPGISFGSVWNISRETKKVTLGFQLDLWFIAFGGGGYRYRSNLPSPHQYGFMARIPFVD